MLPILTYSGVEWKITLCYLPLGSMVLPRESVLSLSTEILSGFLSIGFIVLNEDKELLEHFGVYRGVSYSSFINYKKNYS